MGTLVSRGYVNSNFTLRDSGTADTSTSLIAYQDWIETNYWCAVSGNQDGNRCPDSDELSVITTTTTAAPIAYINITNTSTSGTITQILVNSVETIGYNYEHGSQRYTTQIGTYTIKVVILDLGNGGKINLTDSASTADCENYAGGDYSDTYFYSCVVNATTAVEVVVSDGNCA